MRKASIDIGSNSLLLLAADCDTDTKVLLNEANVTGLGRDLDKANKFIDIAMEESFEVLKNYVRACESIGIKASDITVTATEASRVATNAPSFFERILKELNLQVTILTGEGEAFYSTKGILFDKKITDAEITIMDIGGASTELIRVETKESQILKSFSMPVGAVRVNNWRADEVADQMINQVLSDFNEDLEAVATKKLYCVAGTMTSVGNMFLNNAKFEEDQVNGLKMTVTDVWELKEKNLDLSPALFLKNYPFLGKRSQTISAGLYLAAAIMKKLGVEQVYISTYGLRYGTLISENIDKNYIWKQFK